VKSHALLDIELIKGTPTELNSMLIRGNLDISPVSSIEYGRNHESLMLFPDFTVSSDGEVKSIMLISRFPMENLSGKKIALTNTSATSHVLLKLILNHGYNVEPEYVIKPPDFNAMFADADAALLIGDIALNYYVREKDLYVFDLGIEWKKLTGKKMVYAVWAVSRNFALTNKDLCEDVFEAFRKSKEYSIEHMPEIVEYAAKWEPFSSSFLTEYFGSLYFNFEEDYQEGLMHFYDLASAMGEIQTVPELNFIDVRSDMKMSGKIG
jgi:chorismate dehydratase